MVKLALAALALSAISCISAAPVAEVNLEERQSSCAPVELYHLAGTGETGLGIVGNAFARALPQAIPGATVKAINYDTAAEYFTTVASGASTAASTLTARATACPNTKFVLTGYSKGALVVHQTTLSSTVQAKMLSVVVFGDPNLKYRGGNLRVPLNNQACFFSFCNQGDQFCQPNGFSLAPHLAYATDGSVTTASRDIAGCYA